MNKLQLRQYQEYKIKQAINDLFYINLSYISKRGVNNPFKVGREAILQEIANETNLKRSPYCWKMIGECLKQAGVITVASRGHWYYVNISNNKEALIIPDMIQQAAGKTKD